MLRSLVNWKLIQDWAQVSATSSFNCPALRIDESVLSTLETYEQAFLDNILFSLSIGHFQSYKFYQEFKENAFLIREEFSISDDVPFSLWCCWEHDRRELTVYMVRKNELFDITKSSIETPYTLYKLIFPYSSIDTIVYDSPHLRDVTISNKHRIYLSLRHPPQIWRAIPPPANLEKGHRYASITYKKSNHWKRLTSIPDIGCTSTDMLLVSLFAQGDVLCIEMFNAIYPPRFFHLKYSNIDHNNETIIYHGCHHEEHDICNCPVPLATRESNLPSIDPFIQNLIFRLQSRLRVTNAKVQFRPITIEKNFQQYSVSPFCKMLITGETDILPYPSRYLLHALSSRPWSIVKQMNDEFFVNVRDKSVLAPKVCTEALEQLLIAVDQLRPVTLSHAFQILFLSIYANCSNGEDYKQETPVEHCCYVRKVVVTPSRQILMPPEMMLSNRVVRQFGEDYLLRVIFRDDDMTKLNNYKFLSILKRNGTGVVPGGGPLVVQSFANLVVRTLYEPGVSAAGRCYNFLGWSNSQLRDHGCYLIAPVPISSNVHIGKLIQVDETNLQEDLISKRELDAKAVRTYLGDFTHCESLPKMMSRIGQCFSQALMTIDMRNYRWKVEKDIVGGHNDISIFTDGCGRMTQQVARDIALNLQLDHVPSAFQVRFKGFKGMLAIDPVLSQLDSYDVIFRESQCKFSDVHEMSQHLEVVKHSMPSEVTLNRPFINIVDQVSQRQQYASIEPSHVHDRCTKFIQLICEREMNAAAEMLTNEVSSSRALRARLTISIDARKLLRAGVHLTMEPFFRSLLLACHKYTITQQIVKSKASVPIHYGRTLYGVIDESGLLMPNQVHIRYSKNIYHPMKNAITVVGRVLVTKNPCLGAGDVRVFEAVAMPHLDHLIDVIVFPRYGNRPQADEMAGSDLDGDEFSVIWHPLMLFNYNEPPMTFPHYKAEPLICGKLPDHGDIAKLFTDFLSQDSIGTIGSAHLAQSDRIGLFSDTSQRIAFKNSVAVDFPKTGKPARALGKFERPHARPDFMQTSGKREYLSTRLNGCLHRQAHFIDEMLYSAQAIIDGQLEIDKELIVNWNQVEDADRIKQRAIMLRDEYNMHVQKLIDSYGIENEAQLVSGQLSSVKNRLSEQEKNDYSYYNTDKIVQMRYQRLFANYRWEFFEEFGGVEEYFDESGSVVGTLHTVPKKMQLKAMIWYTVTYDFATYKNTQRYRSFAWLAWDVLAYMKREKTFERASIDSYIANPVHLRIGQHILQNYRTNLDLVGLQEKVDIICLEFDVFQALRHAYGEPFEALVIAVLSWFNLTGINHNGSVPIRLTEMIILLVLFACGNECFDNDRLLTEGTIQEKKCIVDSDDEDEWFCSETQHDIVFLKSIRTSADVSELVSSNKVNRRGYLFETIERAMSASEWLGSMILHLTRQWLSIQFRLLDNQLSLPSSELDQIYPVILGDGRQHYLSTMAFVAYNQMSMTASSECLFLRKNEEVDQSNIQNCEESFLLSLDAKAPLAYQMQRDIEKYLQRWSKCHEVRLRLRFNKARLQSRYYKNLALNYKQKGTLKRRASFVEFWVSGWGTRWQLNRLHTLVMLDDLVARVQEKVETSEIDLFSYF